MDMRIEVCRQNLRQAHAVPDPDAPGKHPLENRQARLRIRQFALTANNVTYAAFGEAMKYWQFFPAGGPDWGVVPVWGFADVVESRSADLAVGTHCYGFFPMSCYLVIEPCPMGRGAVVDASAHRAELPAIYNRYLRQPAGLPGVEDRQALLQPLFATAFLIDDFLASSAFFGATQVMLSSASSKTAWCTAFCLRHRSISERPRVVGLTSAAHVDAVRAMGCYDETRSYDELDVLDAAAHSVYVDMAGDASLRARVHARWADRLVHSAAVGGTHWSSLGGAAARLAGPRPTLFFAPAQAAHRAAQPPDGWGPDGLRARMDGAWARLCQWLDRPDNSPIQIERSEGIQTTLDAWSRLVHGDIDPTCGLIRSI